MTTAPQPAAILVSRDLIFQTKVTGTGAAVGAAVQVVSGEAALARATEAASPRLVMVDMALPVDEATAAITKATRLSPRPQVVAFYSHVHDHLRQAAQAAGADTVWPRSRFSEALPDVLKGAKSP